MYRNDPSKEVVTNFAKVLHLFIFTPYHPKMDLSALPLCAVGIVLAIRKAASYLQIVIGYDTDVRKLPAFRNLLYVFCWLHVRKLPAICNLQFAIGMILTIDEIAATYLQLALVWYWLYEKIASYLQLAICIILTACQISIILTIHEEVAGCLQLAIGMILTIHEIVVS